MPKLSIAPKSNEALSQAVLSFKEIKAKIKFLENELLPHKQVIELACSKTENGKIVTEEFSLTLAVIQKENFKLKDARLLLGDKLSPFISLSTYTALTVK